MSLSMQNMASSDQWVELGVIPYLLHRVAEEPNLLTNRSLTERGSSTDIGPTELCTLREPAV